MFHRISHICLTFALAFLSCDALLWGEGATPRLFDMEAIRDASTLDVRVIQDWHRVDGPIATRQKLVTIHVGEMWPGQPYRMPVRMIVPADSKATGFHLTGGNDPERLKRDTRPSPLDQQLLGGGVGLVSTVVQVLQRSGLGDLERRSEERFHRSLQAHDKIQYWAWPATMMRAITVAHSERDHFEIGKVAMSGGSKNGATPSLAIIHDLRMTAVHASVSPIWDSPLRLCDREAWDRLESKYGPFKHPFLGGHYGPIFNRQVLAAGHSWADLREFAENTSGDVFISRNLKKLRERGVDMLFHPGTHDFVAFDMAWGGKHHRDIPIYLRANSGHGKNVPHPGAERDEQNRAAFLLSHFFESDDKLLSPPESEYELQGNRLTIRVAFAEDSGEESGRVWWMFDRPDDGSPGYLTKMIPDDQAAEMKRVDGKWVAEIEMDPKARRVDFFTNHRKTVRVRDRQYKTYLSSPYTRVELSKD